MQNDYMIALNGGKHPPSGSIITPNALHAVALFTAARTASTSEKGTLTMLRRTKEMLAYFGTRKTGQPCAHDATAAKAKAIEREAKRRVDSEAIATAMNTKETEWQSIIEYEAISRLTAWVRDFGNKNKSNRKVFVDDVRVLLTIAKREV